MIDVRALRENPEPARASQRARGANPGLVDEIIEADAARREALQAFETLRATQKEVSKSVGRASKEERPAILAQANIIRKLAEEGPCIIVGRGADYILRDREDVLNVFLYADQADKLAYAMDTYGDRPEEAEQRVRQVDASRESYYHYLTRAKWGDLKRYHLSLNTSPIGKEGGADLIVQYAKLRRAKLGL